MLSEFSTCISCIGAFCTFVRVLHALCYACCMHFGIWEMRTECAQSAYKRHSKCNLHLCVCERCVRILASGAACIFMMHLWLWHADFCLHYARQMHFMHALLCALYVHVWLWHGCLQTAFSMHLARQVPSCKVHAYKRHVAFLCILCACLALEQHSFLHDLSTSSGWYIQSVFRCIACCLIEYIFLRTILHNNARQVHSMHGA